MRDKLMLFGITLGKRNTYKRKVMFINEFSKDLLELGIPIQIQQSSKKKLQKCTNVLIGDMERAEIIFVAGYDTADKIFIPKYQYTPFNTAKNMKNETLNLWIQCFISLLLAAIVALCLLSFNKVELFGKILLGICALVLSRLILWITKGIGNSINFNRNSASITIIHEIMTACAKDKRIAAILADDTVASYRGLKQIRAWFDENNLNRKKFVLLDCLAYGEMLVVAHGKAMNQEALKLKQAQPELEIYDREYKDERVQQTALSFLPNSMMLVSGEIKNKEFVVENTRSHQDYRIDVKRCEKIKEMLIRYCQERK